MLKGRFSDGRQHSPEASPEPGKYRVEWAIPIVDVNPKQITGDIELKVDGPPTGWVYGGIPLTREYVDPNGKYGVLDSRSLRFLSAASTLSSAEK